MQQAGDIVALFGIECASGDTFTDGSVNYAMTSIRVPEPVMSVSLTPKSTDQLANFQKALQRFQREDPTFHVANNAGEAQPKRACVFVVTVNLHVGSNISHLASIAGRYW